MTVAATGYIKTAKIQIETEIHRRYSGCLDHRYMVDANLGKILRSSGLFRDYSTSSWLLGGWGRALERRLSSLESGLLRDYSMIIDDVKMVGPGKKRDERSFFLAPRSVSEVGNARKKISDAPLFSWPCDYSWLLEDYYEIIVWLLNIWMIIDGLFRDYSNC